MRYCSNFFQFFQGQISKDDVISVEPVQLSSTARTFAVVTYNNRSMDLYKITPRRETFLGHYATEEELAAEHPFARCVVSHVFYHTKDLSEIVGVGFATKMLAYSYAERVGGYFFCEHHKRYELESNRSHARMSIVGIPNQRSYLGHYCNDAVREIFGDSSNYHICSRCGSRYVAPNGQNPMNPTECINCCSFAGGVAPGRESGDIRSYHSMQYHSTIRFAEGTGESSDRTQVLHIGAELEQVGNATDIAKAVERIFGNTVAREYDCTVSIECITHPWSLKYWEEHRDHLAAFYRAVKAAGGEDDSEACGMHMHIDRAYFPDVPSAVAKLTMIFQKYWRGLCKFSRRTTDNPRWAQKPRWTPEHVEGYLRNSRFYYEHDYNLHASAINLQHTNTIEIRLWNGTIDVTKLYATLKLTARLAEIAKTKTFAEIESMTWEDILGDDEEILQVWNANKERRLA